MDNSRLIEIIADYLSKQKIPNLVVLIEDTESLKFLHDNNFTISGKYAYISRNNAIDLFKKLIGYRERLFNVDKHWEWDRNREF